MKLIRQISDLNKAISKQKNLGFVPTMGSLHKGHEFLIKTSKQKCIKTLVSIFINPTQFNNKNDFINYPSNLNEDLKILKKLKVDYVFLPSVKEIYKDKKFSRVTLKKSQKILCARQRKGHFEGVLNVLDRFIKLISPKIMFMGEKDYQQYFLVRDFISKKYSTNVHLCKTIRSSNGFALSSRNKLLSKTDLKKSGLIANKFIKLKISIFKKDEHSSLNYKKINKLIQEVKKSLIKKYHVRFEYIECRNLNTLTTNLDNKPFKIFVAYYLKNVRLIDNF